MRRWARKSFQKFILSSLLQLLAKNKAYMHQLVILVLFFTEEYDKNEKIFTC